MEGREEKERVHCSFSPFPYISLSFPPPPSLPILPSTCSGMEEGKTWREGRKRKSTLFSLHCLKLPFPSSFLSHLPSLPILSSTCSGMEGGKTGRGGRKRESTLFFLSISLHFPFLSSSFLLPLPISPHSSLHLSSPFLSPPPLIYAVTEGWNGRSEGGTRRRESMVECLSLTFMIHSSLSHLPPSLPRVYPATEGRKGGRGSEGGGYVSPPSFSI